MIIFLFTILAFDVLTQVTKNFIMSQMSKINSYRKKNDECITQFTKWYSSGLNDNELKYLGRHEVTCPKKHLLRHVKLEIDKKSSLDSKNIVKPTFIRFKYRCCRTSVFSCEGSKSNPVKSGNIYRLSKIVPKCSCNKVLKSFRFVTTYKMPGLRNPKTHVKFICCSFHSKKMKYYKRKKMNTQWNDSGKGRTKYLSNHKIKCQKHSFISSFKMILQDKNIKNNPSTRFDYSCIYPSFQEKGKKNKRINYRKEIGLRQSDVVLKRNTGRFKSSQPYVGLEQANRGPPGFEAKVQGFLNSNVGFHDKNEPRTESSVLPQTLGTPHSKYSNISTPNKGSVSSEGRPIISQQNQGHELSERKPNNVALSQSGLSGKMRIRYKPIIPGL